MSDLGDFLQSAAAAARGADPETTAAIAQASASPTDAIINSQAAANYNSYAVNADNLSNQPIALQAQAYGQATASQQNGLAAAGYKPPKGGGGGGLMGLVGRIGSDVFHNPVTRFAQQDVQHPIERIPGVGPVVKSGVSGVTGAALESLGAPLRAEQHIERTLLAMSDEAQVAHGDLSGAQGNSLSKGLAEWGTFFGKILSPSQWSRDWDETSTGSRYILPSVTRKVQDQYGSGVYQLAYQLATGATPQQLVNAVPADQQDALKAQLATPEVGAAINALNAGHVSIGRYLVGENFIVHHPQAGNALSGGIDAVMDIRGDPTIVGAKVVKGFQAARYAINDQGQFMKLYEMRPSVQRFAQDVAGRIANDPNPAASVLSAWPKLEPVIGRLVRLNANTPDKVATFFSSKVGTQAIIQGMAAHVDGIEGGIVPHLSTIGQYRLAAKGALTKVLDWGDNRPSVIDGLEPGDTIPHPLNPPGPIARLAAGPPAFIQKVGTPLLQGGTAFYKSLTTLVPHSTTFDLNAPDSLSFIRNGAKMVMSDADADAVVQKFAMARNLAERRAVYLGVMNSMAEAGGWGATAEMRQAWLDRFASKVDGLNPERAYSAVGAGERDVNGVKTANALYENQATNVVGMPGYLDVYKSAKQASLLRSTVGVLNANGLNGFMNFWRGATLARVGFALRASGEEAFRMITAEGARSWLNARLAWSALKNQFDPELSLRRVAGDEIPDTWDRWVGHLPTKVQDVIHNNPNEMAARWMADRANRALGQVQGKLASNEYLEAARELARQNVLDSEGAFGKMVSASDRPFDDVKFNPVKKIMQSGRMIKAEIARSGAYRMYQPPETLYDYMWHKSLAEIARSHWARTSMENRALTPLERQQAVADEILKHPEFWQDKFQLAQGTNDGRLIATGESSLQEAAMDHAQEINRDVDSRISSPSGQEIAGPNGSLADHLLEHGRPPSVPVLSGIDESLKPEMVKGPEWVETAGRNWYRKLNDWIFTHHVGPTMDWMSREPAFLHQYVRARRAFAPMRLSMLRQAQRDAEDERQRTGRNNVYFHGTSKSSGVVKRVDYGGSHNLYGPGFYTTDDPAVASGYAGQVVDPGLSYGLRPESSPAVFRLGWNGNQAPRFIDLEEDTLPADVHNAAQEALHATFPEYDEFHHDALTHPTGPFARPTETAGDQIDNLKDALDDYAGHLYPGPQPQRYAREERFWEDFHQRLQNLGYDGFQHTGGVISRGDLHQVTIWFDPSKLGVPTPMPAATNLAQLTTNADKWTHDAAMQRAVNETIPYIHNPDLKSQFSVLTRNLMPFWFAQEQFYKRWARTAAYSPWAFRKAQLINQGIQHSGLVHTDPTSGQERFIYPLVGAGQDVITRTLNSIGIPASLPIAAAMTGQVNQLNPGLERLGLPNFGPFVVVPMGALKQLDPQLSKPIDAIEGPVAGSQTNYLKMVMPITMQHVVDLWNPNLLNHDQVASTQMQVIQNLEAAGHGIGAPAANYVGTWAGDSAHPPTAGSLPGGLPGDYVTDNQGTNWVMQLDGEWRRNDTVGQQAFMTRVRNWTRIWLGLRAVFGYASPASPSTQFDSGNLQDDLAKDLKTMPFNDAINNFMAEHPDATPYTVFQTKTAGDTPPPATKAAMTFMDSHADFMTQHRLSGSYFIPQPATQGAFSSEAYQEQLADGMRIRKSPQEFYDDVIYQMSAKQFFAMYDQKQKWLQQPPAGYTADDVKSQWKDWSSTFMKLNPLFAQVLNDKNSAANRRSIMQDVGNALRDPKVPQNQATADIKNLYEQWQNWQNITNATGGTNAPHLSTTAKNYVDTQFATWAEAWVKEHPDVSALYNKAIRPGLTTIIDNSVNIGQPVQAALPAQTALPPAAGALPQTVGA